MSAADNKTTVLVEMERAEVHVLLSKVVKEFPHPIPYNLEHKQWDLMEKNLDVLSKDIENARRLLKAIQS